MNEFEFFLSELITRVSSPDTAGLPGVKSDKFLFYTHLSAYRPGPVRPGASHWSLSKEFWPRIGRGSPLRPPWRLLLRIGFKLFSSSLYSSPTWINSESISHYCDDTGATQLASLNVYRLSFTSHLRGHNFFKERGLLWLKWTNIKPFKIVLHSLWLPSYFNFIESGEGERG